MRIARMLLLLSVCLSLWAAQGNDITCSPTTPIESQSRTELKHRNAPDDATATATSVPEMLHWATPAKIGLKRTRESEQPIDPKEEQAFALEGNLWRIGLEGNDCDFHMELADVGKGKAAQRVIVEIPPEEIAARKQLLDLLPAPTRTQVLNAQPDNRGNYRKFNLNVPIHIKVTGFGFFDAHHYSVNWKNSKGGNCHFTPAQVHQRGSSHGTCNVGTIWELHPIWLVERRQ